MTWHLFGMVLTHQNTAANNRGENRDTSTTLQKILRNGDQFTTVSAEAIRHGLREVWQMAQHQLNRTMPDHRSNIWEDREFKNWSQYLDDDVLGFMHAGAGLSRRGILEISRAISTKPWVGETVRNFASPASNPAVSSENPIPYGAEVHHTRYQYGFAMTPDYLGREGNSTTDQLQPDKKQERVKWVLEGLQNLRHVGGNHARYLYDFSPEAIVLRLTEDPAPRFFNCFKEGEHGEISVRELLTRVKNGDVEGSELIIGSNIEIGEIADLKTKGAWMDPQRDKKDSASTEDSAPLKMAGVKAAITKCLCELKDKLSSTKES